MKKVIFDIDGVLLSEERYFDVSGLVVWEWLYGKNIWVCRLSRMILTVPV